MSGRRKNVKRRSSTNNSTRINPVKQYDKTNNNTIKNGPIRKGKKTRKTKEKNKHKTLKRGILIAFAIIILMLLVFAGIFVGIVFSDKFALTREDLLIGVSNTIIYDADGNIIAELSGEENRKIISIDDMSEYLPKAFVAIEDERFYQHKGVDIKRTAAATVTYVTHSGESNFGGSTITQQLVKNITNEKDSSGKAGMQRKIREMSRAYQIEKMLEKKEILQLYLNLIPLASSGGDICGVEVASMYYFNKSARDLSIEESAFLAGVTHSPAQYNPYRENPNIERMKSRTKTVLGKMKELGYIDDNQYNEAVAKVDEGLKFEKGELPSTTIKDYYVSAAVEEVVNDLVEQKGMSVEYARNRVFGGGLRIYTTQKKSIQETVQEKYKLDEYVKPSTKTEGAHTQSAMVIIDHTTGGVVGCMGGLGTDVDAIGINRINSKRQPGSSIKPIGVYGPALEKGIITAATVYDNSKTTFGTSYSPNNASSSYSGLCTIRQALEVSSNIVAAKVITDVTPDGAIDFMRELGISTLVKASESTDGVNDSNTSLALGTADISPLEMAAAYATIANDGVYIEPTFYTRVEDSEGNVVMQSNQETRRVFSEGNSFVLKSLLKQVVEGPYGTAKPCKMNNMDVSAKTGTTQNQYDLWLCGFTPYYTAATWFGYDVNENIVNYGGSPATLIWADVMKTIHSDLEGKRFDQPGNVVSARVCKQSGKIASNACSDTYSEFFVEGAIPGKCEGHNAFEVCTESNKLATEYCPSKKTVYGLAMPEKESNSKWKTESGNKYSIVSEKCDVHKKTETKEPSTEVKVEPDKKDTDITVPNVVGMSEVAAKKALENLNVVVEYKVVNDNSKAGKVISQSISSGAVVSKKAKITIVLGKVEEKKQPEQPAKPVEPEKPVEPVKPIEPTEEEIKPDAGV